MIPMTEPAGFTKTDLELAAGARSYERGLGYLHAVADLEVTATEITATVYGSSEYRGIKQKRKRNLMKILDQNGL